VGEGSTTTAGATAAKNSLALNKYTLLLTCQKLFTGIIATAEDVPIMIREVLRHVSDAVSNRFPAAAAATMAADSSGSSDDVRYKAVGGFMFLRFIVPAITAPHIYGLFAEPPDESSQRKLVLLSKVLQNLANGVQFGAKEEYMSSLNTFIVDNLPLLHKFFDTISSTPVGVDSSSDDLGGVPPSVTQNAALYLYGFVHHELGKVTNELSLMEQNQLAEEVERVLKEIGEPAAVKKA